MPAPAGTAPRSLAELVANLRPEPSEADLFPALHQAGRQGPRPLVVIDDDPTGVQTVHDTPVLLSWGDTELNAQMAEADDIFFVLTNSRSMPEVEAACVNEDLAGDSAPWPSVRSWSRAVRRRVAWWSSVHPSRRPGNS